MVGTYGTGNNPSGIASFFNPTDSGSYLYETNLSDNTVWAYKIGSSGALSLVGTYRTGPNPSGIAILDNGVGNNYSNYLYVADKGSASVPGSTAVYKIGSGGTLSPIGAFATGAEPLQLAIWQ